MIRVDAPDHRPDLTYMAKTNAQLIVAHTLVTPYHCIDFTLTACTRAKQLKITLTDIHYDVTNQSSVSIDPECSCIILEELHKEQSQTCSSPPG